MTIAPLTIAPAMSSTLSFIDRWYDYNYSGVEELRGCASCGRNGGKWPWEQAVLSRLLLDGNATLRARVRLLDPGVYNGPGGHMVRHLYGTWRSKPSAATDMELMFMEATHRLVRAGRMTAPQFIQDFERKLQ